MLRPPPRSPLFPYTTLFRSSLAQAPDGLLAPVERNVLDVALRLVGRAFAEDRKSTRLNSSHLVISYAVFCLKKKKIAIQIHRLLVFWQRYVACHHPELQRSR